MNKERLIELAREAGLEVHPRKEQIRVGFDALLGIDSTEKVERFAQAIRNEALEDAMNICESHWSVEGIAQRCYEGIHALKEQQ